MTAQRALRKPQPPGKEFDDPFVQHVHDVFHETLNRTGMHQSEFAEFVGLDQSTVSLALKNSPDWRLTRVAKFFRALGYEPKIKLEKIKKARAPGKFGPRPKSRLSLPPAESRQD